MNNFEYQNPVKIIFGKGTIEKISANIPTGAKVMMTYGGGSIQKNGVYEQVKSALSKFDVIEFSGIEPNPRYETLMKAVETAKANQCDFLLAVGGGSVLDGTKFIAAAILYEGSDPWDMLANKATAPVKAAVPVGAVLTLAATGSEMNGYSVISRESTQEKLAFGSPLLHPKFSVLDPETTTTLPERQTINGVIDAFVHVFEQYMTYDVNSPLQDRQAEAILRTLISEGPKALDNPQDYDVRANLMWAATHALNNMIGVGVPHDWATHMIGHEVTALHGLDHAQSLAAILPALLQYKKEAKKQKMIEYGRRVWHILDKDPDLAFEKSLQVTIDFFKKMKIAVSLKDYGIDGSTFSEISTRFASRNQKLGEHQDIGPADVEAILQLTLQ